MHPEIQHLVHVMHRDDLLREAHQERRARSWLRVGRIRRPALVQEAPAPAATPIVDPAPALVTQRIPLEAVPSPVAPLH